MKKKLLSLILLPMGPIWSHSQKDDDISEMNSVIDDLYNAISAPIEAADWGSFKSLFHSSATFGILSNNHFVRLSLEQYKAQQDLARAQPDWYMEEEGRKIALFDNLAQVLLVCQYRFSPNGPIQKKWSNAVQVIKENNQWHIANIISREVPKEKDFPSDLTIKLID